MYHVREIDYIYVCTYIRHIHSIARPVPGSYISNVESKLSRMKSRSLSGDVRDEKIVDALRLYT